MVAGFNSCDKRRLRQVLAGSGSEELESVVAGHLESCASCRRDLELLAGGDEWLNDVRSYLTPVDQAGATDNHGRTGTALDTPVCGNPHDAAHFAGWQKQLAFLAPTETDGSLGRLGS